MSLPADNNLLSVSKASSLLEVSSDTLRRLDKKGQVIPKRGPNGERLYSADDVSLLKQILKKPVGERSYGIQETANILRVSPQTIRRWEREGKITTARTPGGQRFFTLKDIQALQNLPRTVQVQTPTPQIPTPAPAEIPSPVLPFPMPEPAAPIPEEPVKQIDQPAPFYDIKPFVTKKRRNYVPYIIIALLILLLGSTVAFIGRQTFFRSTASNGIEANLPVSSPSPIQQATTAISNAFKLGSVIFQGADGQLAEDNNNLFWDGPNAFLGIGTNLPNARLTVSGGVTGASLVELIGQDSNNILSATSGGQQVFNIDHAGNTQIAGAISDINDSSLNVLENLAVGGDLTVAGGDITSSDNLRIYSTKSTTLGSSSSPTTVNGKDITFKNSVLTNSIKLSNTATVLPNGNTGIVDAIVDAWNHGGSSSLFSAVGSGTNTTAAMVVGSGATFGYTGTGTINASSLEEKTWATPGAIGLVTPNTGAFTTLSASSTVNLSGLGASSAVYTDDSNNLTSAVPTSGQLGYWTRTGTNLYNTNQGDKVGIGTTSPSLKASIYGTDGAPAVSGTAQTGIMRLEGPINNVLDFGKYGQSPFGAWLQVTDRTYLGTSYPLVLQPNGGNVGIGTTGPTALLHVTGATIISQGSAAGGLSLGADVNLTTRSTNTRKVGVITSPNYVNNDRVEIFSFNSPDVNTNTVGFGGRAGGSNTAATELNFITATDTTTDGGTVRMYINSTGNVGIGTTSPGAPFTLQATSGSAIRLQTGSGTETYNLFRNAGTGFLEFDGIQPTYSGFSFFTNNGTDTEKVRITNAGNVGIGTTSPTSALSVGSSSQFQVNSTGNIVKLNNVTTSFPASQGVTGSVLTNSDGAGTLTWASPTGTGISGYWTRTGTNLYNTNQGDNVGIGTTTPAYTLDVNGIVNLRVNPTADTNAISRGYVESRGMNMVTNGTGQLLNNYNFSGFTFDNTDLYAGNGMFTKTSGATIYSDEFIPVDPTRTYRMSLWSKTFVNAGSGHNTMYAGIAPYDMDGSMVASNEYMRQANTDTTLAAPLKPGDTTITLTSAANWNNGSSGGYTRAINLYPYISNNGYAYPNYTYSKHASMSYSDWYTNGAWAPGGISGNVITLRLTWPTTAQYAILQPQTHTTGNTEPTWPTGAGSTVYDNNIFWQEAGSPTGGETTWSANTIVTLNAYFVPTVSNGHRYQAIEINVWPAGTAVTNATAGGGYKYIAAAGVVPPTTWTNYTGSIGGWDTTGSGATNKFPYGTASIKLLFLPNYQGASANKQGFSDIWFSELSSNNLEVASATQIGVVNLSNQQLGAGDKYFGGNVGIGTTGPQAKLHVLGPDANGVYGTYTTATAIFGSTDDTQLRFYNDTTNNRAAIQSIIYGSSVTDLLLNPGGGNVGIGTTAPGYSLDVAGNIRARNDLIAGGTSSSVDGNLYLRNAAGANNILLRSNGISYFSGGNVGIGTTSPASLLHVYNPASNAVSNGITAQNAATGGGLSSYISVKNNSTGELMLSQYSTGSYTTSVPLGFTDYNNLSFFRAKNSSGFGLYTDNTSDLRLGVNSTAALSIQGTTGNVGIGTTSPGNKLDVSDSSTSTASAMIRNTSATAATVGLAIKMSATAIDATTRFINFMDLNGTIIGKVQGNTATTVSYTGNGTDMAEYFVKDDPNAVFVAGTVMCQGPNGVLACSASTPDKIVGIVSDSPVFLGGVEGPDKVIIGLTGQVPVLLSPASPDIKPGDMLTVVDNGLATKVTGAGYIIGKAQNAWSASTGAATIRITTSYIWADPALTITNSGNLNIAKAQDGPFQLTDSSNNNTVIDKIGAFGQMVTANVKAGAVVAQEITTNSFIAFQGTIDHLLITSGLVSANIQTALISPIPGGTDVTIQLGNKSNTSSTGSTGKLSIQNADGTEVASIDSSGSAAFASATISGTLYADEIKSKSLDDIKGLLTQVQTDQNLLKDVANWNTLTATNSASLDQIAVSDLYVTNQAAINSLSVTNTLTIGSDLVFQSTLNSNSQILDSSINTLSAPLKIQSLAMAPVEIMAGLVTIDTHGNVNIAGDLFVAGRIKSSGLTLKPDLTRRNLVNAGATESASLLSLQNNQGAVVASVDASGSAMFTNIQTQRITGSDEDRGSVEILPAEDSKVVQRDWNSTPSAVLVSSSYKTQAWVTDTSDKGFTIRVSDSPADSIGKLFWWALW